MCDMRHRSVVTYDIVVIGAGFAGSLLARLLAVCGRRVLLVERDAHPRFALGESSTPLAALSLERLARRYRQPDLHSLAAHGRWRRDLSQLRCGLKRGFTFFRHHAGDAYRNSDANDARYLVAASPDDEAADCQWMRADVDAYLVEQARAAGVDYRDRLQIIAVEPHAGGLRLRGRRDGRRVDVEAGFVVDGSGSGEVVARALGIESISAATVLSSQLVYAHFDGVPLFAAEAARAGARLSPGPYADDWAAVHHLLDDGWIYSLRFDDGLVSAGLLLDRSGDTDRGVSAQDTWEGVLRRYGTLHAAFGAARPVDPGLRSTSRLQRRRREAVGPAWAMLPQTFAFFDPMFSTGIAWSLLGVERLAQILTEPEVSPEALSRYQTLLDAEATQQQALLEAAYAARHDFAVFRDVTFLYFACVSFEEIRQRLFAGADDHESPAWRGFLGAGELDWTALFCQARAQVVSVLANRSDHERCRFSRWVADGIRRWNLIGLGECPTHLYGVDLELLLERSALLGLTAAQMEALLPRLRGAGGGARAG